MPASVVLPHGYRDARTPLLVVAILGEVLQGGLFFGWNALSIMMTDLGNFSDDCPADPAAFCKSRENKLAVMWTVGIFALNCGPVVMGFVLDYLGPKFTALLGVLLNMLGLVLFGISGPDGPHAFIAAAIILGLGNITFHLAQFHISALFPRHRGLVSSAFVAGFTGSGVIMYILLLIFQDAGSTSAAYKGVIIGYAGICALWLPLEAWMMPNDSFKVGSIYLMTPKWRFERRQRNELERLYRRTTSLQDFVAASTTRGNVSRGSTLSRSPQHGSVQLADSSYRPTAGLVSAGVPDSSHPAWLHDQVDGGTPSANGSRSNVEGSHAPWATDDAPDKDRLMDEAETAELGVSDSTTALPAHTTEGVGPESQPLPPDVMWGPLVFEARRFVELRKKSFKEQFLSVESFGMGIFYTLNVFFMQFYLGTTRLQLEHKGDANNAYSNLANVVVAFAFVTIPMIGWLLDRKGYGLTLGTITTLSVLTSVLQAIPSLPIQVLTIITWMVARFFMYSSYFAIFGALFGFRNFGKLVAIDNTFNGLFGLLQYPLSYLGIQVLDGNFTVINICQAICLLPLFIFCYYMYKWEREDLVPIRPMEGEELPCDMVGQRSRKQLHLPHVSLPHVSLPNLGGTRGSAAS